MGVTATYALPFPELADPPNGPEDVQALAEATDDARAAIAAAGLVTLWDSAAAGVVFPAASVTTPPLSQAYTHLSWEITARCDVVAATQSLFVQFNGDTAPNYAFGSIVGQGVSGVFAGEGAGQGALFVGEIPGASAPAARFGILSGRLDNYRALQRRAILSEGGVVFGAGVSGVIHRQIIGAWENLTDPVSSLTVKLSTGMLIAGSRIVVKGEV